MTFLVFRGGLGTLTPKSCTNNAVYGGGCCMKSLLRPRQHFCIPLFFFFLPLETFSWVAVLRSWMSLPLNNVWFPNASYFKSVITVDIPLLWTMLITGQGREFARCRKLLHWRWMSRTLKIDGTALHAAECPHNNHTARSFAASEATWTEKMVKRWR